jgi:hypothetical protein
MPSAIDESEVREVYETLIALGEHAVRLGLQRGQFAGDTQSAAIVWLAMKDQERLERTEARTTADSNVARMARTAAVVAAVAAVIGIVISTLAWLFPRASGG